MISEETLQAVDSIPDVESVLDRLRSILVRYPEEVRFAFLFGSYAAGTADIWSDVDVGIYFARNVNDHKRKEIRFALMDTLEPLETNVAYLDDEDVAPEIFIAASEGVSLVMNDQSAYHEALLKNIHTLEEMRLIGLAN